MVSYDLGKPFGTASPPAFDFSSFTEEREEEKVETNNVLILVRGKCNLCKRPHTFTYESSKGADRKCGCSNRFLGHDFPFIHDKRE